MKIHTEQQENVLILRVSGDVDLATAPDLEDALSGVSEGSSAVVDLSGVGFMDSTGLNALVSGRRAVTDAGGSLALVLAPDGAVARLLSITGMDDVLPAFDDVYGAVASFT